MYHADGFLEKNRNFLPAEVIQLVRQSQFDMIRFMFQCPITKTGNLYSALPESAGSRQNLLKVDTKVGGDPTLLFIFFFAHKGFISSTGTLQLSRIGIAIPCPTDCSHLLQIFSDGFTTENGGRVTSIR